MVLYIYIYTHTRFLMRGFVDGCMFGWVSDGLFLLVQCLGFGFFLFLFSVVLIFQEYIYIRMYIYYSWTIFCTSTFQSETFLSGAMEGGGRETARSRFLEMNCNGFDHSFKTASSSIGIGNNLELNWMELQKATVTNFLLAIRTVQSGRRC